MVKQKAKNIYIYIQLLTWGFGFQPKRFMRIVSFERSCRRSFFVGGILGTRYHVGTLHECRRTVCGDCAMRHIHIPGNQQASTLLIFQSYKILRNRATCHCNRARQLPHASSWLFESLQPHMLRSPLLPGNPLNPLNSKALRAKLGLVGSGPS